MHPSSSPITRDEQRGFGQPLATARNPTGARVLVTCKNSREREREREREKEWYPRVSSQRRTNFYKVRRAVAFILHVESPAVDQASSSQPCSCLRKTMTSSIL
jgi:hypothetical protein